MQELTQKQLERIPNLRAFAVHFPGYTVKTYKTYQGKRFFYVLPIESEDPFHDYVQVSDDLSYINGWLYGAVQAVCILRRGK